MGRSRPCGETALEKEEFHSACVHWFSRDNRNINSESKGLSGTDLKARLSLTKNCFYSDPAHESCTLTRSHFLPGYWKIFRICFTVTKVREKENKWQAAARTGKKPQSPGLTTHLIHCSGGGWGRKLGGKRGGAPLNWVCLKTAMKKMPFYEWGLVQWVWVEACVWGGLSEAGAAAQNTGPLVAPLTVSPDLTSLLPPPVLPPPSTLPLHPSAPHQHHLTLVLTHFIFIIIRFPLSCNLCPHHDLPNGKSGHQAQKQEFPTHRI